MVFLLSSAFFNAEVSRYASVSPSLKPETLHIPMGGMENVVADILWMRLIQFMGTSQNMSEEKRVRHRFNTFDQITRLDPKFYKAYKHGVLSLFVKAPDKALTLLDRGLKYMSPDQYDWKFPFYGAFICYRYAKEDGRYNRALRYIQRTQNCESAPDFVGRFGPLILEKKKQLSEALDRWIRLWKKADEPMNSYVLRNHLERITKKVLESDAAPDVKKKAAAIRKEIKKSETKDMTGQQDHE